MRSEQRILSPQNSAWKVFRISTVRYNWPMSAHASQAFSIAHCTNLEDLPSAWWKVCHVLVSNQFNA